MRFNRILRCITPEIKPILSNKISCSQCKFYNPNKTCKMFNEIDIVTMNITNSFAVTCREDETKCGSKAVFYVEKEEDKIQKKEDIKKEEDEITWNDVKYPVLIYSLMIIIINMDSMGW